MSLDPYKALGVAKDATADEIKKAYRKIARSSHPDLNPSDAGAEARFKAASAAFDLLKDPETRARYDRGEIDASGAERQQRQYYRDYAEQPDNPYRRAASGQEQGGEFHDAADIFAEFFRQRGQAGGGYQAQGFDAKGNDRRYTLEVPFLDAARGGSTRITLPDGATLEVKIPEGTADGQTIRLRGKGDPGLGEGPPGDALITVTVAAHPVFTREGNDTLIDLPITLDEAVLGGKVQAPTIHGPVNLSIPKAANTGRTLRLKGKGVKTKAGTGDQKVVLKIVMPDSVDEELAAFMSDWRKTHAYDPRKGMQS